MYKKWKYCHRKQPVENLDVRSSRYHYSKKAGGGGAGGGGGGGGGGGSVAPPDPPALRPPPPPAHPRTPPSYVPAVVRENEYVLHFIDEQGLFSMGLLRETLNSASRTLQC